MINYKLYAVALLSVLIMDVPASGRDGAIEVGDLANYRFQKPMLNGMGLASIEELQGKPVLVEFWGHRCPPCISAAVPGSLRLAEEFGDDLAVIFVESQGLAMEEIAPFTYGKKWMGTNAVWTSERPFETGSRGLPNFVLLSIEGKVLMKGHPLSMEKKIEETIRKEIARAGKAPQGTPRSLGKAWKDFGKSKYASAFAGARKVLEAGGEDAVAAQAALDTFMNRLESNVRRVDWMINNGYYIEAERLTESMSRSCKGTQDLEQRVKALEKRLSSPELKNEKAAAESFAKIRKKIQSDGLDKRSVKLLEKFIAKREGTRAAEHASRLVAYADVN